MGRNKDPEQTRENIIDAAARLFLEQGYEQTSIQDLLDELKLSKGGLYHHFKSKEEILTAVMQRRAEYALHRLHEVLQSATGKTARERLQKILYQLVTDRETQKLDAVLSAQISPHFVVGGLRTCMEQDAPVIAALIQEGLQDGSLKTAQPALCSEVFLMLLNYWANPVLFGRTLSETEERLNYLKFVMCQLGLDILDEDFIDAFKNYFA